ncbi:hypothetical protein HYQ46_007102 [Verticillium longisporum]|nr:hypothetical protein HYQ46_007102 [Verticillium longisporum]
MTSHHHQPASPTKASSSVTAGLKSCHRLDCRVTGSTGGTLLPAHDYLGAACSLTSPSLQTQSSDVQLCIVQGRPTQPACLRAYLPVTRCSTPSLTD